LKTYPGYELDELHKDVERHVLGLDSSLTFWKQELKDGLEFTG